MQTYGLMPILLPLLVGCPPSTALPWGTGCGAGGGGEVKEYKNYTHSGLMRLLPLLFCHQLTG